MDSGFYGACSGLVAKTRQLEIAAHNIANVSTTAFKSQQLTFSALLAGGENGLTPINEAINSYGVQSDASWNLSGGSVERTGNELDLAIEGNGYFAIQMPAGQAFTRDGHFHLSSSNQLVTAEGKPVLGEQGPISVPSGTKVSVSPDGTITANGALVSRLRVVEFATGATLQEVQPGLFVSPNNPIAARNPSVRQGALESSNVSGIEAAVNLIAIQRQAEMLERALSIFHSEFNRIAAGDLSRV